MFQIEAQHDSVPTTHLDGANGSARVVLIQVVDVSGKRNAQEVIFLPQATQLLI